jgi:hypothetical protein
MMLKTELQTEFAHTMADNADPNLAVAKRLPDLCCVNIGFRLVKTGNTLGRPSVTEHGTSGCRRSRNG